MCKKTGANFNSSINSKIDKLSISSTNIPNTNYFLGRETELTYINNSFQDNKQIVILYGIGGIGKTELATQFVTNCNYLCPQVIVFKDDEDVTFEKLMTKIIYPQEIYDKVYELISINKELAYGIFKNALMQLDENVILFIDNSNKLEVQFLDNLIKVLKCKIILTTRKKIELSEQQKNKIIDFEIKELSLTIASKVFQHSYNDFVDNEETLFEDLIYNEYYGNTQAIVMIAKMLKEQGVTLSEYSIKKELFLKEGKFSITIHGENKFDTVANNLCQFFRITGYVENSLQEVRTQILAILMVTEQCGIDENSIIKELSLETSNNFIELSNRGLINRKILENNSVSLTMHPMVIKALTFYGIQPDKKIINFVKDYVKKLLAKSNISERSDLDNFRKLSQRLLNFGELRTEHKGYNGTVDENDDIIDILLNEDNNKPIVLLMGDGREITFDQIAVIPYDDKLYCILKPLDKIDGVSDDEAIVFYVNEEIEPPVLMVCTDEKTAMNIFKNYYELLIDL